MRALAKLLVCAAALLLLTAAPASAAFGLNNLSVSLEAEDGSAETTAGSHPFAMTTTLDANTTIREGKEIPDGAVKDLRVALPAGMVGNPRAVEPCPSALFARIVGGATSCPDSAAVGFVDLKVGFESPPLEVTAAVYSLTPPPGVVAKLGFVALGVPVTLDLTVNESPPYNVVARLTNISQAVRFYGSSLTVWGNPVSSVHDADRGVCATDPEGTCPTSGPEVPFLVAPRSCSGPLQTRIEVDSWQDPGAVLTYPVQTPPGMSGCPALGLTAEIGSAFTSRSASSASGLDFGLDVIDEGLNSPVGTAGTDIKRAVVTLPAGATVNPSVAEGLATCTEADLARETAFSEPGAGCPQASKVGEVEVETPLLEGELLRGQVFVATQEANPFGSLIALYMVIKDPGLGILVKLPGRVDPDPRTGQLITSFGLAPYEVPQFPFSHFRFHFREGARAPLITPPLCGSYATTASFTPWANPASAVPASASFVIDHGLGGGPCPAAGIPPFAPGFQAGSINNAAGAHSPYYMRLTRTDGEQDITRFDAVLPPGVTGKIAGIPHCPDAAIAAAKLRPGRAELAVPSCPAAARIGRTLAGAGVGSALTYVPGTLYLAGPYAGDPLSVVSITPAVAGPFDAGTVVVREALDLNPDTAEVEVDGAASDPIPHILKGIPLHLRDLRVYADRPGFTLNPTSCAEEQARATLFGSFADPLNPADDVPVSLADRYQAASCASLQFKPKLRLTLKGATKRAGNPSLRAELRARPGDANVKGAEVILPRSQFIDNSHINNPCTRVQFNAGACPKSSVLGRARAFTPLLDSPLEGPVYFRSNGGLRKLPDVVAALRGQFGFNLVIAILEARKGRVRTKVLNAPDAPVSKFVLRMAGGRKGLLQNNRNLCRSKQRATLNLTGQNGRRYKTNPLVKLPSCKKHKAKRHRRR